tara:strand:- start:14665 stop:16551 length:1887 start_codon:yes stop_codon:yes gene_type:complete
VGIKYSYQNINHLLLIPSLWLGIDFLPLWFIFALSSQLLILTFFKIPSFLLYINFIIPYLIFKEKGIQIVPETMIPVLAAFLMSQLIANKSKFKEESFIFFLWIGIFSVFSSSFNYLVYSAFVLLYYFLQQASDESINLKSIFETFRTQKLQLFFTLVLALVLFFFFPRFYNFLPSANSTTQGEVGYSGDISNKNISQLSLSNKTAFYAETPREINPNLLYWRGRVNTQTDGYSWWSDKIPPSQPQRNSLGQKNLISIDMKYELDFKGDLIILDSPHRIIESNLRYFKYPQTNEFRLYRKRKKVSFRALSDLNRNTSTQLNSKRVQYFLQLPPNLEDEIKQLAINLQGKNAHEIINNFKRFLIKEEFSYTLEPGLMQDMGDFLSNKKGFCTHYSSLLGIILRLNKIPTRLISGFQGGIYNKVGGYYQVTSNDAHAWVEYYENNNWQRVDPTGFVSPNRINFGGERFLTSSESTLVANSSPGWWESKFNEVKLNWNTLNYKVSLFFDNFDRNKQKEISQFFKIKLTTFFITGGVLIGFILGIFIFLTQFKQKPTLSPLDKALIKFSKKLKIKPSLHTYHTIKEMKEMVSNLDNENNKEAMQILDLYQEVAYSKNKQLKKLKTRIANYEA